MRLLLMEAAFILLCSFISLGQKYYTLASGNWNNTTNVWSLNGVTPCGCFPGNNLVTDSLIISHPINLTSNINASTLSKVQINPGGNLSNSGFDLIINNSVVLANGGVNIRNLYIGADGRFEINSSTLIVNVNMDIYGSFYAEFSNLTVMGGNIQVFPSGSFIIGNNSRLHFLNGNFRNEGFTSICSDCCLSFDKGNVTNESTGTFTGGGTVLSTVGNIKNYGTWDPVITYCSSGNDVGMVSQENCIQANILCTFAPLPTELVAFTGYTHNNANILVWETASEINTDHYEIERSMNGLAWTSLGNVDAEINSQEHNAYSFSDLDQGTGILYYRLTKINTNGEAGFIKTLSLVNDQDEEVLIFPNPAGETVWIHLDPKGSTHHIRVLDPSGRIIQQIATGDTFTFELPLPSQDGLYFIHTEGQDFTHTYTLVKQQH
jgi:hypothetical protein